MRKKLLTFDENHWEKLFFTIWTGQAFSIFGSSLVEFSLIWYLTDKTGSATVLSINMLFMLLPYLLLSPFAGALVDRWSRRWVMIVADTFIAFTTVLVMGLFYLNAIQTWHIYLVIFLRSSAGLFHYAAMQASTSLMVPEQQLNRVNGLNQALRGGMNIIAPPIGAILIGILPMHQVLLVDIITAAIAVIPLLFILIPQPVRAAEENGNMKGLFADIRDGISYTRRWPGMVSLMVVSLLVNFAFNPINALLPLVVKNHFMGGALQLSWVEMGIGLGIVVGGITMSIWGGFRKRMVTVGLCLTITGLGFMGIGFLPSNGIWLCVTLMFAVGVVLPFIDGLINAIIQSKAAPEYQGRLVTLLTFSSKIMVPLSMMISGPVADSLGVLFWYRYGGLMIVLLAIMAFASPALMRIEEGIGVNILQGSRQHA
jgi:DHA3 family macrolide efflux protein-like MFS transporter